MGKKAVSVLGSRFSVLGSRFSAVLGCSGVESKVLCTLGMFSVCFTSICRETHSTWSWFLWDPGYRLSGARCEFYVEAAKCILEAGSSQSLLAAQPCKAKPVLIYHGCCVHHARVEIFRVRCITCIVEPRTCHCVGKWKMGTTGGMLLQEVILSFVPSLRIHILFVEASLKMPFWSTEENRSPVTIVA